MEERLPAFPTVSLRNALEESRHTHTISSAPRPDERHGPDSHVELARVVVRLRDTVRDPERESPRSLIIARRIEPLEQLICARIKLYIELMQEFGEYINWNLNLFED